MTEVRRWQFLGEEFEGRDEFVLASDYDALAARVQAVEQARDGQMQRANLFNDKLLDCESALRKAEQQVARLRESSNDLVEFFAQNHEDVGEELYGRVNGKALAPTAVRLNELLTALEQALRETGA